MSVPPEDIIAPSDTAVNIGAELSIINVFDPFNELEEPGIGSSRTPALPRTSTILPPLKVNELSVA